MEKTIPMETYLELQHQFNRVVSYSQKLPLEDIHSDRTFAEWAKNKYTFYKAFGDKLIYNYGLITTSLSKQEKQKLKEAFDYWVSNVIYADSCIYWRRLVSFIIECTSEEFFNNSLMENTTVTTPEGETKILCKGTKLLKAIRSFFPPEEEEKVRIVQDKASEYIQKDKIEGELCLSIHPLDFLSLSENASNWRSCHSLDGDYRAGNLSYLMDSSTVIAYIKSSKDKEISRFPFPWNDKKWRNLLFFNNDLSLLMAGRPYPFESTTALIYVEKALNETIYKSIGVEPWQYSEVTDIKVKTRDVSTDLQFYTDYGDNNGQRGLFFHTGFNRMIYDPQNEIIVPIHRLIWEEADSFCHYNDLLYSSTYFPYFKMKNYYSFWSMDHSLEIGHEVYCLLNEEQIVQKDCSHRFYCVDCIDMLETTYCACDLCGHDVAETWYIAYDDVEICENCWNTRVTTCDKCGITLLTSSVIRDDSGGYCPHCYEKKEKEKENGSSECE